MPDASKRTKAAPDVYVEEQEIRGGDGARWEQEQMLDALFHVGAKDRKDVSLRFSIRFHFSKPVSFQRQQEFDLVLDEEIDFVQALQMPGSDDKVVIDVGTVYETKNSAR